MNKQTDITFRTSDTHIAAFILTKIPIERVEISPEQKVFFHFKNVEKCELMDAEYRYGQAKVDPKNYALSLRNLKQIIYKAKNENG